MFNTTSLLCVSCRLHNVRMFTLDWEAMVMSMPRSALFCCLRGHGMELTCACLCREWIYG
jgi:hypothetical protein